jgi:outer membrane receptor protein involved in Fe transport
MNRIFNRLGFTAVAIVAGPALIAQSSTTGALNGVVADNSGAPLAGATVRLSSGQITRTTTTGADGRYNLGLLNPGAWVVTITKAGYASTHENVSVSINAASTANFKLAKEGGATVEVVASAISIDATSTTTGSTFSMDTLSDIPKGRDIGDVAFMTPGVSFSGFNANDNLGLNISIAGASGAENSFSVDGLRTNDMRYGGQGVTMSQEFVDQIEIQTGGYKPEYSSMGGVFNVVTKSGSNTFAGSAWVDASPGSFSPGLKKNTFYSEAKPVDVYEAGALASGAIVKDKLFYAVGLNWLQTNTPASPNLDGLSVGAVKTPNYQFFGKLNYFLNTDNQLTLSYFGSNQAATQDNTMGTPGNVGDGHGDQLTGNKTTDNSNNVSLVWDSNLASNLFLSVKVGQANRLNEVTPTDNVDEVVNYLYFHAPSGTSFPGGPGYYPGVPVNLRWITGGYGANNKETNLLKQGSVDLTWILGDHSLKFGVSDMTSRYEEHDHRSGADSNVWYSNISGGNMAISRRLYTNDSVANAEFQAIYLQDTWQATKGLNLFYGARAEHQIQKGTDGHAFMDFGFGKYIQPRLGFTWDPKGDGTSKLSGSYAIYYEQIPQRMAIRTYGNENYYRYNYYGSAYTGPVIPWNTSINPNQPWNLVAGQTPVLAANYSTGWSQDPIADGIKLPQRVEVKLGYDQQISATTTLGIHGTYRKLTNPMEDSELGYWDPTLDAKGNPLGWTPSDPADNVGGQAIIWNPKASGVSWTSPFSGQKVTVGATGYPEAYNEYKSIDLSYTYKTSSQLLFVGYTWSRNYGSYEGLISPSNGQADGNITASFDYPPYVGTGLLPIDRTHSIKAYGFQKFMVNSKDYVTVGFNLLSQSGTPISLQDDGSTSYGNAPGTGNGNGAGDPGGYGNSSFANGQMGQYGRTPWQTKVDLNVQYTKFLSNNMKLSPYVQLYNVFNARPTMTVFEQATDVLGNPSATGKWGSPTSYQAQRSVRFGVRLNF